MIRFAALLSLGMFRKSINSQYLNREVLVDVYVPKNQQNQHQPAKLLVINDGQDADAFHLKEVLADWEQTHPDIPVVALAVHVGERKQEYGVSGKADFAQRGSKAGVYARFIVDELLPWARENCKISGQPADQAIAGFSLGALSAFDIAWHHADHFQAAGLFSGSFWWRSKDLDKGYQPSDRIALQVIEEKAEKRSQRFWFQTGWHDESADRDHDGLIDSIGDTLDVMLALQQLGYKPGIDFDYVELGSGHHDHKTMARVFPQFLQWWLG